ncbi:MAG: hypothetical protein SGJ19_11380 [Planctomycetia bacterium]|nr:hypothetical protein [Planctomycetia bacterium]
MVASNRPPVDANRARPLHNARQHLGLLFWNRREAVNSSPRSIPAWHAALFAAWCLLVTACYLYWLFRSFS